MSINKRMPMIGALVAAMSTFAAPHAVATAEQQTSTNKVICVVSGPPVPTICVPKPI